MPKLTPEFFANLPEEIQEQILADVPVDELSNIQVVAVGNYSDDDDFVEALHEAFDNATEFELRLVVMELIKVMITNKHQYEDLPPPPQMLIRGMTPGMISVFLQSIRDEIKKGKSE